jgi:uncharacterized protein (UPF0276 family)
MDSQRCGVGLFYNSATAQFLRSNLSAVDYVEIAPPEMSWTDESWTDELDWLAPRCALVAHGTGRLAVGSAAAFDEGYLAQLAGWLGRYPFHWHSDHLSYAAPGSPAPLPLDHEVLDLVADRAFRIHGLLGIPFLLENPVYYVRLVEQELEETAFLNALVQRGACGLLLDLHNLYANSRNFRFNPFEFLAQLDMAGVKEVHIAGGAEFAGMYTDAHAGACHPMVWELLDYVLPRAPNLRGITFEFHEAYFPFLGEEGVLRELARAREIARRHVAVGAA